MASQNIAYSQDTIRTWQDSIQFDLVRFFEKGREEVPFPERVYADTFDLATTRYVSWELHLKYPSSLERQAFAIQAVFYNTQGEEVGRIEEATFAAPYRTNSFHYRGWGWPEAGYWPPGTYKVAFFINERRLGDGSFTIVPSPEALKREEWLAQVEFDYLRFYEKGRETIPYNERTYRSRFESAKTRYVAWELHLRHPKAGQSVELNVKGVFYQPNGQEFGQTNIRTNIGPDWEGSWHTAGWGWSEPGYWRRGIYKVEFFVEETFIGADFFEIK